MLRRTEQCTPIVSSSLLRTSDCLRLSPTVYVYPDTAHPPHRPARSIHNLGNLLKKTVEQCVKDTHYDVWPWMLGVVGLQYQTGVLPLRAVS